MWFAISEAGMDPVSRLTNTILAGRDGRSGVEVGPDQIRVQMGGFKLTVPRASIHSASRLAPLNSPTCRVGLPPGPGTLACTPEMTAIRMINSRCYLSTAAKHGLGVFNALVMPTADQPWIPSAA